MERAREVGSLGRDPLERQVAHAWGFAECAEAFLRVEPGDDLALGSDETAADAPLYPPRFLDLGSGAGLPGLVLAHLWRESEAVLLDASLHKSTALGQAIDECGWTHRVKVVRARAETAGRSALRGTFDLVVARSFGPPPVTAECAAPFLRLGGLLIVSEPPSDMRLGVEAGVCAPDSGRWPSEGLAVVGLEVVAGWRREFGYQVLRQSLPCPMRFPRREGIPSKRPVYRHPSGDRSSRGA